MTTQSDEEVTPILELRRLKKYFPVRRGFGFLGRPDQEVKAVDDVSFNLMAGETLGLVGESGCGKSTTGRSLLRLTDVTAGEAIYKNQDIFEMSTPAFQEVRKDLQMVFQDPYSSLNPRNRIGTILEEPLKVHHLGNKAQRTQRVLEILEKVGLGEDHYYRYPHEFSGGQKQRIGVARALIVDPKIVICDEPVSALDVSIQAQILNLLKEIQKGLGVTYLFISHDLSVVKYISDRIVVMYLGHVVEEASTDELFSTPLHPYTQALLSAVPRVGQSAKQNERITLQGDVPSPLSPPSGCVFNTRCPYVMDKCRTEVPVKNEQSRGHKVACHLYN